MKTHTVKQPIVGAALAIALAATLVPNPALAQEDAKPAPPPPAQPQPPVPQPAEPQPGDAPKPANAEPTPPKPNDGQPTAPSSVVPRSPLDHGGAGSLAGLPTPPQPSGDASATDSSKAKLEALQAGSFADAAAVEAWMQTYYLKPEPDRVLEAFRTLAAHDALGPVGDKTRDKTWALTAFFWAAMKDNAPRMAEWTETIGPVEEPAKTWWWTAVWMSQTEAGNQAIRAAMQLPEGHQRRIAYEWLKQPPQDPLQRDFRGPQQIGMLWYAFCASGHPQMIYKLYEAFVIPDPPEATDPVQQQLRQKRIDRNREVTAQVRRSFAENLPRHPRALEICKESVGKLREPVKSEVARLIKAADPAWEGKTEPLPTIEPATKPATEPAGPAADPAALVPASAPVATPPGVKPTEMPNEGPGKQAPPLQDEPGREPKDEPATEPKDEPRDEPKPEPK